METLLNKLIEKGWKPRGEDKIHNCEFDKKENKFIARYIRSGCFHVLYRSLTELYSKSSGLWQFVCENRMTEYIDCAYCKYIQNDEEKWYEAKSNDYEYRLIESSLKDESELEDFLLQNIKIDE